MLKIFKETPQAETAEVQPWYHKGLRFSCTECGQCCTGAPGYTWLVQKEIEAIALHLKISVAEFVKRYLRRVGERWALLEHPVNYDCIFLKDKKCSIYQVRPKQCRTFPWWMGNLQSKADWEHAATYCEGINCGELVPYSTIAEQLALQEAPP